MGRLAEINYKIRKLTQYKLSRFDIKFKKWDTIEKITIKKFRSPMLNFLRKNLNIWKFRLKTSKTINLRKINKWK